MSPLVIDMATSPSSSDTQSISNQGNTLSNQGNTQHGNSSSSSSSRRENSVQTAEHKRRLNIKLAFEKLQSLIPMEQQQDGSVSKKKHILVYKTVVLKASDKSILEQQKMECFLIFLSTIIEVLKVNLYN